MFYQGQKILFAPLNWGLGHASRSIPLIQKALNVGSVVYIASDGAALDLLKRELPSCTFINLPAYDIRYKYTSIFLNIFVQLPRILITYIHEKQRVSNIVDTYNIDLIVSDNRFGAWSNTCTSIYITHQLSIFHTSKWISKVATLCHQWVMMPFDEIWVPDIAGDQSFAGLLSKNSSINSDRVKYLGPITRLKIGHKYKGGKNILVMLSGPEPQRTSLENKLIDILQPISQDILFIRGAQKPTPLKLQKLYEYIDLANSVQIEEAIAAATLIICRSGYSTVMDLSIFDKKIIYIPTPGQTEQEYLADYHGFHNEQVTSIVQKALESDLLKVVMKG